MKRPLKGLTEEGDFRREIRGRAISLSQRKEFSSSHSWRIPPSFYEASRPVS